MMTRFPVGDIIPRKVRKVRRVSDPVFADSSRMISQHEFSLEVEKVGSFYAYNGSEVEYAPVRGTTQESLELYLNGSVYGAILHQRGMLPLHGSCFAWHDKGIMLCGESGAGKSSLTAAFFMAGAEFLTDDVTPIVILDGKPFILPLSDRIKLWEDSLQQLNRDKSGLTAICPGEKKYYFPMEKGNHRSFPLHRVFIIEIAEDEKVQGNNGRRVDTVGTHSEVIGGTLKSDITGETNNNTGTKAEDIDGTTDNCAAGTKKIDVAGAADICIVGKKKTGAAGAFENYSAGAMKTNTAGAMENCAAVSLKTDDAGATEYCSAETLKTGADGAMENSSAGVINNGISRATINSADETKENIIFSAKQKEAINEQKIEISELEGINSFAALRNEVYRWEYLSAMPETEAGYLDKLLAMSRSVTVTRVRRPGNMGIGEMRRYLEGLLHL